MAYPEDKPSGNYTLRDYDFATLDQNKIPMNEYIFKNGYKNADESEVDSVPDAHEQNWLFDILHRNLRYTLDTAEENKRLLETKLATPTSIGQVKVGYGLDISSNGTLSVQKGIAEDANIISYDLPVGSYMLWAGNNPPEYFIEPAGQTLLRSNYPELWEFAQSNNLVGKLFGAGDGSTTFTVTDIRGNFISIANSNDKVGKFTEAGLPDHNHSYKALSRWGADPVGSNPWWCRGDSGGDYVTGKFTYASASNSIYGKSKTVTPANWGLKIILKALPTPPSNAVPTGTILNYTGAGIPDGYILPNGAEVSRTTFANLYRWALANDLIKPQSEIPTTAHAYYGSGNGSTTFTIPDLRGCGTIYSTSASGRGKYELGKYEPNGRKLIDSYVSGTEGYNIYSDGYCEQWGEYDNSKGSQTYTRTINLIKTFSNTNYNLIIVKNSNIDGGIGTEWMKGYKSKTTKSFVTGCDNPNYVSSISWRACGYLADSEYKNIQYKNLSGNVSLTPILKY